MYRPKRSKVWGLTTAPRTLNEGSIVGFRRHANGYLTFNNFGRFDDGTTSSNGVSFVFNAEGVRPYVGGVQGVNWAVGGAADMTALFDQWRIKGVSVKVFFTNTNSTTATTTTCMPIVFYAYDSDDIATPTEDIIQSYPSMKSYQWGNGSEADGALRIYFKPKAVSATGTQATGGTGGQVQWPGSAWMDMATPSSVYFGLKMVLPANLNQSATSGRFVFSIGIDYEYKGIR